MDVTNYSEQVRAWPSAGQHILAQSDRDGITVYQAYRPAIADFALDHQRFGGEFSYSRMSWIKPGFLWMMYRSGWATKAGQERILAIRLRPSFFDEILRSAVPSSFDASRYRSHDEWRSALATSDVRLQWDPDHDPAGRPVARRAVQLGLRGEMLRRYGDPEILAIDDMTDFVTTQRAHLEPGYPRLLVPTETVYRPEPASGAVVGIDEAEA